MKLSIVIPVYCVESTLGRCLESIVGQSFTDFEVILVDDGSPDSCPKLCDEWASRDARIRVIHQKNGGLSNARNTGIRAAIGDVITFVDSDDYVDSDTYKNAMPFIAEADIVEFPVFKFYGSDRQTMLSFSCHDYNNMPDYWLKGRAYEHAYAWNKLYRRQLFEHVRFPEGVVFEDVHTLPRLLANARLVRTIDKGLYYYCYNQTGITATAAGSELSMLLDAHCDVINRWCDDRYYLHVLNIQMDVYEQTGGKPQLPHRRINLSNKSLSPKERIKGLVLNILGVRNICKLNKTIHQWMGRR